MRKQANKFKFRDTPQNTWPGFLKNVMKDTKGFGHCARLKETKEI